MTMLKPCALAHKEAILAILNDAIAHTTALYDYKPRALESMDGWFEAKSKGNFPVIGAFDDQGNLLGFGSYGVFRNWPAYKYSVEHSVYVAEPARGKGIGKQLLLGLLAAAENQGYHTVIGGIDSGNSASIKLHEGLGFEYSGTIRHAGFKFGKWLDLRFYQKILRGPVKPTEH
jgi:L-amino acid N-acyltransferase